MGDSAKGTYDSMASSMQPQVRIFVIEMANHSCMVLGSEREVVRPAGDRQHERQLQREPGSSGKHVGGRDTHEYLGHAHGQGEEHDGHELSSRSSTVRSKSVF